MVIIVVFVKVVWFIYFFMGVFWVKFVMSFGYVVVKVGDVMGNKFKVVLCYYCCNIFVIVVVVVVVIVVLC